jgi:oligosaccharide repeat unit polymerase
MGYQFIYQIYMFTPSEMDRVVALMATSLGLIVFMATCVRSGHVPMVFRDSPTHRVERQLMRKALPIMLLICVPIGVYSLKMVVDGAVSGESSMITVNGVKINTTSVGYMTDAMLILVPVCGLFAWYHRFRLYAFLPLAIFFVVKASTGGRGPVVVAAAGTAYFFMYDKKIKLLDARILALAAFVAVAFTYIGQDRGYALRQFLGFGNFSENMESDGTEKNFIAGMDFANMEYLEYMVYVVPQRSGTYDYFLANLQLLTEPVPRALWPGKPVGAPIKTINLLDYGNPMGITASLPGVGWFELGWLGVVIWCGLWGWGLGAFYRWFAAGPQDAISVSLYLVSLPILIIAFRDGALLTVVRTGVFYVIPVLVMMLARRILRIPTFAHVRLALARQAGGMQQLAARVTKPALRGRANRLRLIAAMPQQSRGE